MAKKILLVGTLDSKGREIGYLGQRVEERGWGVIILDAGTLGNPKVMVSTVASMFFTYSAFL